MPAALPRGLFQDFSGIGQGGRNAVSKNAKWIPLKIQTAGNLLWERFAAF